jgi:hypothetical protein
MLQPPSWKKDALPTNRGWAHPRTGEILKSQKMSDTDINDYLGISSPSVAPEPIPEEIEVQPEMLVEEEAPDLSNMTKLELETYGRTKGIELDRRKSKADLINTLNEG